MPKRKTPSARKSEVLSIRIFSDDLKKVRSIHASKGLTAAAVIRLAITQGLPLVEEQLSQ